MLTQISLTNFKSWKSIDIMPIASLTGLFGTNSSGKSSILQLLLMLKQTIESSDRAQVLEFGDENSMANLGSFGETIYGHNKENKLELSLSWKLPEPLTIQDIECKGKPLLTVNEIQFKCSITENGTGRPTISEMSYSTDGQCFILSRIGQTGTKYKLDSIGNSEKSYRFTRTTGRVWDLPSPVKFYGFPDQVYAYYQNAGFLAELQLALEKLFSSIYYLGPLREFPQRFYTWKGSEPADMGRSGERVVDAILAAREKEHKISLGYKRKRVTLEIRVATWLKELGLIHSFHVEPVAKESGIYQVKVQKSSSSAKDLITDVGFGVSQILPVLVLCYYVPEGSVILLEQPEIHLHPSVQSGLSDVFIDAVKNRKLQIIVESHSEHLLRRFQRRIADKSVKSDDVALYFCEPSEEGSKLTTLDVDLFGNIANWPKDFFGDDFGEMAEITKAAMKRKGEMQA